jgi:hypothetical protein
MKFAAGWGESLASYAVFAARLSPHPVEHLAMLADPPPSGEGEANAPRPGHEKIFPTPVGLPPHRSS